MVFLYFLAKFSFRGRFTVEPSYSKIENLAFGRMAFRGMNPEVERMMEAQRLREEEEAASRREKEVNDEAMAAHFGNLRATVGRKFATKRQTAEGVGDLSAGTSVQDGSELIRRGEELLAHARSPNKVWVKGNEQATTPGSGGSGRGGKRKKFLKPAQD